MIWFLGRHQYQRVPEFGKGDRSGAGIADHALPIGVQGGLFSEEHEAAAGVAFVGVMAGVTAAGYALGNAADRRTTTIQIIH